MRMGAPFVGERKGPIIFAEVHVTRPNDVELCALRQNTKPLSSGRHGGRGAVVSRKGSTRL